VHVEAEEVLKILHEKVTPCNIKEAASLYIWCARPELSVEYTAAKGRPLIAKTHD